MSHIRKVNINKNDLGLDAYGRNKMIIDRSQFSGLFTYDVPNKLWKELIFDGSLYIEQKTFVNALSVKGALSLKSGPVLNNRVQLRSLEHSRYQANRGTLFSTSIIFPNPRASGVRKFGLILPCNGVYFELVGDGVSYTFSVVVKNHFIETRYDITSLLSDELDLSKGNLYDIQMQWRGVGDFMIFINKEEIFVTNELGRRTEISIENPSLPVGFECINNGDDVELICGCVDVSSEGGTGIEAKYVSFTTGNLLLSLGSAQTAAIAVRLPHTINYGGDDVCYSRDAILNQVSTFCKDESVASMYVARGIHLTSLPTQVWTKDPGGLMEYMIGGNNSLLNTAFQADIANMRLVKAVRHEKDFLIELFNPNLHISPFVITADTYIVIAIDPDSTNKGGVTVELSEQI